MIKKMNQVLEVISQKKTLLYAEITLKNLPIPQVVITRKPASQLTSQADNPTTVQKKPAEKPKKNRIQGKETDSPNIKRFYWKFKCNVN